MVVVEPCRLGSTCQRTMPGSWRPLSQDRSVGSPRGIRFSPARSREAGTILCHVTPRNSTSLAHSERRYSGRYTFSPVYLDSEPLARAHDCTGRRSSAALARRKAGDAQAGARRDANQEHRGSSGRAGGPRGGGAGPQGREWRGLRGAAGSRGGSRVEYNWTIFFWSFLSFSARCNCSKPQNYPRLLPKCILRQNTLGRRIQIRALFLHRHQNRCVVVTTRAQQSGRLTQRQPSNSGQLVSTMGSGCPLALLRRGRGAHAHRPSLPSGH